LAFHFACLILTEVFSYIYYLLSIKKESKKSLFLEKGSSCTAMLPI